MSNNFPSILKAFIVITLFIFLTLSAIISFADIYGKDTTEIDERLDLDAVNSTTRSINSTVETWKDAFAESEQSGISKLLDILGFLAFGMFQLALTMISFIFLPFIIFGNILHGVLGIPSIVVAIINALIIVSVIFGIWRLIKRGD